jgi:hypothetical protein
MKNRFYDLYLNKLEQETKKYSETNPTKVMVSDYDSLKLMNDEDRKKVQNLALEDTIRAYAQEEGIDTKGKSIDEARKEAEIEIMQKNRTKINETVDELMWERIKRNPFYINIKMTKLPK